MTLRNVGVDDKTIGTGVVGMHTRTTRTTESAESLVQIIDSWSDIEDTVHLQANGAATLPLLAAGTGFRNVISWTVPSGKIFIPEWVACNATGTVQVLGRVARRLHLWAFAGAALVDPTVPANPTITANASFGMDLGTVSYKFTLLNNVGETLPTAATATATIGASTDGISVPLVAAGNCTYRRIYRTLAGQGGTGPWYLMHEVDHAVGGYTDTHPNADLNQSVQPPGANTTLGSVTGPDNPSAVPIAEICYNVVRVALSASPTALVYTDEDGLQERSTTAVTLTIDTQTVINLKQQGIGFTGVLDQLGRTKVSTFRGGDVNHGLKEVKTVNGNPATGQYNVYGYIPVLRFPESAFAAAIGGASDRMTSFLNAKAFPAGSEVTVGLAHPQGSTPASQTYIVDLVGRLITV